MAKAHTALVKEIIAMLLKRPEIADAWSNNSGVVMKGSRCIRFGREGLSDILGFFKNGAKLLAIEVKIPPDKMSDKQLEFKDTVERAEGVHIKAESLMDVIAALDMRLYTHRGPRL